MNQFIQTPVININQYSDIDKELGLIQEEKSIFGLKDLDTANLPVLNVKKNSLEELDDELFSR